MFHYHPAMDGRKTCNDAKVLALYATDNHLTLADSYSIFQAFLWDQETMTFVRRKKGEGQG